MLFAQSQLKNMDHTFMIENYKKSFTTLPKAYQEIAPFINFYHAIDLYKDNPPALQELLQDLHYLYTSYQQEHNEKISQV